MLVVFKLQTKRTFQAQEDPRFHGKKMFKRQRFMPVNCLEITAINRAYRLEGTLASRKVREKTQVLKTHKNRECLKHCEKRRKCW